MTFISRLAMLRNVVKKGGLIMGADIGKKYTGLCSLTYGHLMNAPTGKKIVC
jgi:hypothetical protein